MTYRFDFSDADLLKAVTEAVRGRVREFLTPSLHGGLNFNFPAIPLPKDPDVLPAMALAMLGDRHQSHPADWQAAVQAGVQDIMRAIKALEDKLSDDLARRAMEKHAKMRVKEIQPLEQKKETTAGAVVSEKAEKQPQHETVSTAKTGKKGTGK